MAFTYLETLIPFAFMRSLRRQRYQLHPLSGANSASCLARGGKSKTSNTQALIASQSSISVTEQAMITGNGDFDWAQQET